MIKIELVFIAVLISCIANSSTAKALFDTTYVYCSNQDNRRDWRWAVDENNIYVVASGNWKVIKKNSVYIDGFGFNSKTYFFMTTKDEFMRVSKYCKSNEIARPADNSNSSWYVFYHM
ncbi:hypothetical protein [Fluviispira multicolorata]|uniref:Uncharacterized protein n=1 Tax=Fluviispira multicolorata TaxID=2654512 RepID=A0A833JBZ9_9BACT|nr:hypothetical protein [Fluviispira multicolorata]KAB8029858.1 hypothetical protein GCL57_09985 [Fluviispira multicolorata]